MNETPLHEPLIAEEGKEKERLLLLCGAILLFLPGDAWDFFGIGIFIIVYCLQRYYCPAGFRQAA